MGILAHEAADNVLLVDLLAGEGSCCFENSPPLNDGDHFQLLLSLVTGISDRQAYAGSFSWTAMPVRLFIMISRFGIHRHFVA